MSTFGWIMVALGLFLVLYTVAFLVRPSSSKSREGLGCGFVLLAGMVWSYAFGHYVENKWIGMRLGFGAALILPAVVALFKAGRSRLVPAAMCFIMGILLVLSGLPELQRRLSPSKAQAAALTLDKQVEVLRSQVGQRESQLIDLKAADLRLRERIRAMRVTDFDAAMADPKAKQVIEELAEIKRLRTEAETKLAAERRALEKLESELRRAQRQVTADALGGGTAGDTDVTDLVNEVLGEDEVTSPATVEDHAAREEMRRLFETVRE